MTRLLILGTGTDQVEGILEAQRFGLYTIGLDWNEASDGAKLVDEFYKVNIKDIKEVAQFLDGYPHLVHGVIAFGVDIPDVLAFAAEKLNCYFQLNFERAKISKDKYKAKKLLRESDVRVPPFAPVHSPDDISSFIRYYGYPVVLKPVDNSGSRGVLLIEKNTDINWAFEYSKRFVRNKSTNPSLMVEKFICGRQLSTESIIVDGKLFTVGLSDRNYELLNKTKPFIVENGGDLPPEPLPTFKNYQELISAIDEELSKALRAFGSGNGTIKGDIVVDEHGQVWIIEVAFRLSGGLFSTIEIPKNTGVNFVKKAIEIQLQGTCNTKDLSYRIKNFVRLRYIFIEVEKGIVKRIKLPQMENVIFKIYCKEGEPLSFLKTFELPKNKLLGYVIWENTKQKVLDIEKQLLETLEVEVSTQ